MEQATQGIKETTPEQRAAYAVRPWMGDRFEWVANANAICMARGIEAVTERFGRDYSDAAGYAHWMIGAAALPALRKSQERVAEQTAPWFDGSAFGVEPWFVLQWEGEAFSSRAPLAAIVDVIGLEANRDVEDLRAWLIAAKVGDELTTGGGAAPACTLRRVA